MEQNKRADLEVPSTVIYPIQLVQIGKLHDVPAPLVRVRTCGGLQLEVLREVIRTNPPQGCYQVATLQNRPKGSSTGLTLLKILASLPEHYASKDWLTEHFPRTRSTSDAEDEEDWGQGLIRIDNVVYLLRGLLCPAGIEEEEALRKGLVAYVRNHRESGPGYRLAEAPLVWLDVDVIAAATKQAMQLEHEEKEALSSWEHAYALASRGNYLPDEQYSDWAKDKRLTVDGYLRQAVHALHRLYLARASEGGEEQAMVLLRSYWQTHPTDEDMLRSLLELLAKRGRQHEADEYYQRLCERLELEGRTPTSRTQQTIQNVRAGQHISLLFTTDEIPASFSSTFSQGIIETLSFPSQKTSTAQTIESDNEAVKRRDATKTIGTLGLQLLGLPVWEQFIQTLTTTSSTPPIYNFLLTTSSTIDEKTLAHLEQLSDVCWHLANDSQRTMVTQILPTFLPKLTVLAGHPSPHQQKIARLVTRGYILAAEVEKKNVPAMKMYCEYAVMYSQMTNDDSIKADALRQKATIALIAKEPTIAVATYQQALLMVKKVSPLLRSRIYLGVASAYARSGQKQEALRSLGLARENYPSSPEEDPAFLYLATSSDRAALHLYEALTYSDLQQPEDAWEALMQVDGMRPKISVVESTRIEFLNLQAKTAGLAGNMELSREYLIAGVKSAKNNGYAIWTEEAYDVYMALCQIWPQEKQIKSLAVLFN